MSNEGIPDKAFFSWLDEQIREARTHVNGIAVDAPASEFAYVFARVNTLREVRAYFGGAS